MAIYGYIENLTASRIVMRRLGLSISAGNTIEIHDTEVRETWKQIGWNWAHDELYALVDAGDIEIREADDITVVPANGIQTWIDEEYLTLSSLPSNIGNTKLDITTPGKAVITKAVAGVGIALDSTGVDDGTGFVTLNVDATKLSPAVYAGSLTSKIVGPSGTIAFLEHDGVLHSEAGFYITEASKLVSMVVNVEEADPLSSYELILYANPSSTPSEIHHIDLSDDERVSYENALSIDLPIGEYGLALKKTTPDLEGYGTYILGLGPEAYYRMNEQPEPPLFVNTWRLIPELGSAGTWVTTTLPGVPANAIVQIAISNRKSDDARVAGVRAVGSALGRTFDMHGPKDADPAKTYVLFHTVANASGQVQFYAENTGEVRFIVTGYWQTGTYVEKNNTFTASASGSWVTLSLSSAGVGSGDIVELAVVNSEKDTANIMGVRAIGSTADRRLELPQVSDAGEEHLHVFTTTANASGQVQVWTADRINTKFRLLGFWSTPPDCEYTDDWTLLGSPTSNDVWEDKAVTDAAGRILDIAIANTDLSAVDIHVGAREPAIPAGEAIVTRTGELQPWVYYWGADSFGDVHPLTTSGDMRVMRSAASYETWKSVTVGVSAAGNVWLLMDNNGVWTQTNVGTTTETYWWLGDASFSQDGSDTAVICYRNGANLELRTWDGTTLSSQTVLSSDVNPSEVSVVTKPGTDEFLILCNRVNHTLKLWHYVLGTDTLTGPTAIATTSTDEAADVIFEQLSGIAHIVYGKTGSSSLWEKTWTTGTVGTETEITAPTTTKTPYFVTLKYLTGTNQLAVAVTTTVSGTADCWGARFNGSAWGDKALFATNLPSGLNYTACDIEFEQDSGQLLASYKNVGSNNIAYRTWSSGSGWSGQLTGPNFGSPGQVVRLYHEKHSTDHIVLMLLLENSDVESCQWTGSAWGTVVELSDNSGETKNQPFTFHHHYFESGVFVDRLFYASDAEKGQWSLTNLITPANNDGEIQWYEATNAGNAVTFRQMGYWTPTVTVPIYDETANNHDGTYVNGPILARPGRIANNDCVQFDGVNDYASVGTWDVSGTGISLKAWVKIDTLPGPGNSGRIIYKGDASNPLWSLEINNNYPRFVFKASSTTYTLDASSTILTTGTWYLIVATYDETTQDYVLYVDGVDVANANTGVGGATLDTTSDPIYIAARTPSLGFLDAFIDEVAVFNDSLTSDEVDDIWDRRDYIYNPDSHFAKAWAAVRIIVDV